MRFDDLFFRVVVPDAATKDRLAVNLVDHLYDSDAFVGFQVRRPETARGFWQLLSGTGEILARSRTDDEVLGALVGHLAAIASPVPDEAMRFQLRALTRGANGPVKLLGARPGAGDSLSERRLARLGLRIVDSLFVDLRRDGTVEPAGLPWPGLDDLPVPEGHLRPWELYRQQLTEVIWPTDTPVDIVTPAAAWTQVLAGKAASGSRSDRLDFVADLCASTTLRTASSQPQRLYRDLA